MMNSDERFKQLIDAKVELVLMKFEVEKILEHCKNVSGLESEAEKLQEQLNTINELLEKTDDLTAMEILISTMQNA